MWCVTVRTNELERQDEKFCLNPGVQSVLQNHQPLYKSPWWCLKQCVVCTEEQYSHQDEIQPAACLSSAEMHCIQNTPWVPDLTRWVTCWHWESANPRCAVALLYVTGMWRTLGFTFGYKLRAIFSSHAATVQKFWGANLFWKDPCFSCLFQSHDTCSHHLCH